MRTLKVSGNFLVIIFTLCILAIFQKSFAENFSITGTVTSAESSLPIANAIVSVFDPDLKNLVKDEIYTDSTGFFSVDFLYSGTIVAQTHSLIPRDYYVSPIYPNPVMTGQGDNVFIQYYAPDFDAGQPDLQVFNILGKRVEVNSLLPSGIYFYRLKFKSGHVTDLIKFSLLNGGKFQVHLDRIAQKYSKSEALKKNTSSFTIMVQKRGYFNHEGVYILDSQETNTLDFNLDTARVSKTIGVAGGVIEFPDSKVVLKIPENALNSVTDITITQLDLMQDDPWAIDGVRYKFEPSGLTFNQPANLTFSYSDIKLPSNAPDSTIRMVVKHDSVTKILENVILDENDQTASASVNSFSEYGLRVNGPGINFVLGHDFDSVFDAPPFMTARFGTDITKDFTLVGIDTLTDHYYIDPATFPKFSCDTYYNKCIVCMGNKLLEGEFDIIQGLYWNEDEFSSNFKAEILSLSQMQIDIDLYCEPELQIIDEHVAKRDGMVTMDLGYLDPADPQARRMAVVFFNPSELEFRIRITAVTSNRVIALSEGAPIGSYGSGSVSFMMLTCGQDYSTGFVQDMFYSFSTLYTLDDFTETFTSEVFDEKTCQVWLGGLYSIYAQANSNREEGTVSYGHDAHDYAEIKTKLYIDAIPVY